MSATWSVLADENGNETSRPCDHLVEIREVTPDSTEGCTDCLRDWHATNHPVMRSAEPGETWAWCHPDNLYIGQR